MSIDKLPAFEKWEKRKQKKIWKYVFMPSSFNNFCSRLINCHLRASQALTLSREDDEDWTWTRYSSFSLIVNNEKRFIILITEIVNKNKSSQTTGPRRMTPKHPKKKNL